MDSMEGRTMAQPTRAQLMARIAELEAATTTKAAPKGEPLSATRASDKYVCDKHTDCGKNGDGHFATANGLAYHKGERTAATNTRSAPKAAQPSVTDVAAITLAVLAAIRDAK